MAFAKYLFGGATFAVSRLDKGTDADYRRKRSSTTTVLRSSELYKQAASSAEQLSELHCMRNGLPGLCIAVSINGRIVWKHAVGFADLENGVRLHSDSVMRIASISKCFTAVLAAKLIEAGTVNLDARVQKYVTDFPEKYWPPDQKNVEKNKVNITLRQLLSHQSGIRHYSKILTNKDADKKETNAEVANSNGTQHSKADTEINRSVHRNEFDNNEYYIKDNYKTVDAALELFKNDPLLLQPGSGYLYTTHGFTLASCVIEQADTKKRNFVHQLNDLFAELGLKNTHLDEQEKHVKNRACYYRASKTGRTLQNVPYVDNSYKWAGGGLLSNCADLLRFTNAMLYAFQHSNGFLQRETVCSLWQPQTRQSTLSNGHTNQQFYGLGFVVGNPHLAPAAAIRNACANLLKQNASNSNLETTKQESISASEWTRQSDCLKQDYFFIEHSGGAVGATSFMLIIPDSPDNFLKFASCNADLSDLLQDENPISATKTESASIGDAVIETLDEDTKLPSGFCVVILCNMQSASGLSQLAHNVGEIFMNAYYKHKLLLRYLA